MLDANAFFREEPLIAMMLVMMKSFEPNEHANQEKRHANAMKRKQEASMTNSHGKAEQKEDSCAFLFVTLVLFLALILGRREEGPDELLAQGVVGEIRFFCCLGLSWKRPPQVRCR